MVARALLVAALLAAAAPARANAEDPVAKKIEVDLAYRMQSRAMNPLSLNDHTASDVAFAEHRLRMDAVGRLGDKVRLKLQIDALDGVLFGDNGFFFGRPRKNRGAFVATRSPNLTRIGVGVLDPDGDPLDRDNYGLVLQEARALELNHVYAEASLPFGLLRGGRQPVARRPTTLVHPGTRIQRWGVSDSHDSVDGVAFATKLSAIADTIAGDPVDPSLDNGLFAAVLVGKVVEQLPAVPGDDLSQVATVVFWQATDRVVLGYEVDELYVAFTHSTRSQENFGTSLQTFTGAFELRTEALRLVFHHTEMIGETREVGKALTLLGHGGPDEDPQPLRSFGGFGEIALLFAGIDLSLQTFYASGDDNPSVDTALTQFTMAEDLNVGLHLFENVLRYYSERSVAIGNETLKSFDPSSFPLDALATRGGLQNAVVFFPQVVARPLAWLDLRAGVMFAFTHLAAVDPIGTMLNTDGVEVKDDLRNFAGGKAGDYWGTEIDVGLTWKPLPGFQVDLEAAWLMPGNALEDEHGDAVDSLYSAVRATWFTK